MCLVYCLRVACSGVLQSPLTCLRMYLARTLTYVAVVFSGNAKRCAEVDDVKWFTGQQLQQE